MGLTIPNLDKKDFNTFMEESLAKLPAYSEEWTDHNLSDPGITIIELLSWMADINSYRLNHLGEEHYRAFVELLTLSNVKEGLEKKALLEFGKQLSAPSRAVTLEDYEYFALHIPQLNLARVKATVEKKKNEVSVLVIPHSQEQSPQPTKRDKFLVKTHLECRKLLTTRLKMVSKVNYREVDVSLKIETKHADPLLLEAEILEIIEKFLHPLYGGEEGKGWVFGEDVHISHIYRLLNELKGVDKIESIYFAYSDEHRYQTGVIKVPIEKDMLAMSGRHTVRVQSKKILGVC